MIHRSLLSAMGLVTPVNTSLPEARPNRGLIVTALLFSAVLLLLPWLIHLDGKPHADWQQFLGRFHPLAVHLPIGLLVLVPLLEIGGRWRPAMRDTAAFVLGLAFLATLGSLTLGFLLAYGSGESGPTVTLHMWGGVALAIGLLLCLLTRPSWVARSIPYPYPVVLTCTLVAMAWTAHQGGSITHGSNYLTQYMPASLKGLAPGSKAQNANPTSFYAQHIHPVFDANCVACHGESKISGGLRLDSYAQLMRGGTDGPVIVSGSPDKSLLFTRITLPTGHKLFMPAEGKPPLKAEEIAMIRAWIQQGASASDSAVAGVSFQTAQPEAPIVPVGDYGALEPGIQQMAKGQGAKLMPVSSKPSDGLVLYTVDAADSFGDAELLKFQKYAPYVVEAELGRTAVTDASFGTLATFTHLRAIHLEGTRVTGKGLDRLGALPQLNYLNLSGTQVTAENAASLAKSSNLRHLYLYDTPAQPASAGNTAATDAKGAQ